MALHCTELHAKHPPARGADGARASR